MLDLTNAIEEINYYKGSEKKKTLVYEGKKYLVKFPDPIREKGKNISYINNAFSEYIGSNIFKMAEFEAQNTLLGKYYYKGKEKIEDKQVNNDFLLKLKNVSLFVVTNSSSVTGLPGLTLFLLREPEVRGTTFKT